jgi:hypothetical protein
LRQVINQIISNLSKFTNFYFKDTQLLKNHSSRLIGLAKTFQTRLAKLNIEPWIAATSQDAKYSSVKGITKYTSPPEKLIGWYMDRVISLTTTHDPQTTLALFEVFHMLKSVNVLFQPRIILQVFKQVLGIHDRFSQVKE